MSNFKIQFFLLPSFWTTLKQKLSDPGKHGKRSIEGRKKKNKLLLFLKKKKKKENPRIRRGKTKESGTGSRVHVHRTFGDFAGNIFRHWHAIRDYSYISKDRYKLFSLPAAYLCPLRPFKIPRAIQPRRDPGFWFSPFDVA